MRQVRCAPSPARCRALSVSSAECSFETDRAILRDRVAQLYVSDSEEAFERFAHFAGIVMVIWSLTLSPTVFNRARYEEQMEPWVALAREVGFTALADIG